MSANELLVVYGWVYQRIVGDTDPGGMVDLFAARGLDVTDHVWEYRGPEDVTHPIIAYRRTDLARDVRGIGGTRVYSIIRTLITVVDQGQDWQHEDILNRIGALFDFAVNLPVAEPPGYIHACERVEPFDAPEDSPAGVQYRHIGGVFDIAAQGT